MGPKKRARSSRSSQSSALDANTKPTTYSSNDAAFEQELIDNGVYPPGYDDLEPDNLEEILDRIGQPRASLSPSQFSREDFLHFRRRNDEATTEAEVMSQVFPMITGRTNIPSGYNQVFNNLKPLGDHIADAQPDYYNGSRPPEIRSKVRNGLEQYIIPSSQRHRHALPNFFTEAKGPDGKASKAKRQITQDLAVGARGMLLMQSYELEEPVFDGKAHTFGSTYHSGTGTLQMYAMHPAKPRDAGGKPEYHTTQIDTYGLTGNTNACRQGIGAWRNLRDLAKERRDEFITVANERADADDEPETASAEAYLTSFTSVSQTTQNERSASDTIHEESETSMDELFMPTPQKKRTRARQLKSNKRTGKISELFVDEDDE
jgi:hypothetical protein